MINWSFFAISYHYSDGLTWLCQVRPTRRFLKARHIELFTYRLFRQIQTPRLIIPFVITLIPKTRVSHHNRCHVHSTPADDDDVVDGDERRDRHSHPADALEDRSDASEDDRGGGTVVLAEDELEVDGGKAKEQGARDVRDQEGRAAVVVRTGRESPDVPEADGHSKSWQEEFHLESVKKCILNPLPDCPKFLYTHRLQSRLSPYHCPYHLSQWPSRSWSLLSPFQEISGVSESFHWRTLMILVPNSLQYYHRKWAEMWEMWMIKNGDDDKR